MTETERRPRLAITLGDVAGIGPEVVVKALADESVRRCCELQLIGDSAAVTQAQKVTGIAWDPAIPLVQLPDVGSLAGIAAGEPSARTGHAAYHWLLHAIELARTGAVDGIVTAPISKQALHQAGVDYPGHTEILADRCGVREFAMMLYVPAGETVRGPHGLSVAHATLHTSIASVPGLLSVSRIDETIRLIAQFLQSVGCAAPRIGVCALNPHAGESGLFGDEESRIILPAVRSAQAAGIAATGPLPADTLLKRAAEGEFDGVVAMYHDQGHIALKLLAFGRAVNVTLGLPFVRTSPSHGTAFDIAGRGIADAAGMKAAICTAATLVTSRTQSPSGLHPS